MRVVLYTHHALFEPALSLVDALADRAEVHLFLEVPPGDWRLASFEAAPDSVPTGLVDADHVLAPFYPPAVRAMWRKAAGFHLVSYGRWRSRDPRSVRLAVQVLRHVRRLAPDVLHVDDVDVSPRLAVALTLTRLPFPVVMGCHDPDPHTGERRWGMKRLTRAMALPRSSACVVHHESGRTALARRHPRLRTDVFVVRLGAYAFLSGLDAAQDQTAEGGTDVLLFGRVTPYKGVELLFRAAPLVAAAVPRVRFTVAGKPVAGYTPPPAPRLEQGGSVTTLYDYVPNTAVGALFRSARVAVCPYTDASQSGVVLTAYAFGCPVVVTDVGGLPEYVEHGVTGMVVPPDDPEALADAVVRCVQDAGLNRSLREGVAAATAGPLGWARVASELLDVYRTVIGTAARGRRGRPRARQR